MGRLRDTRTYITTDTEKNVDGRIYIDRDMQADRVFVSVSKQCLFPEGQTRMTLSPVPQWRAETRSTVL